MPGEVHGDGYIAVAAVDKGWGMTALWGNGGRLSDTKMRQRVGEPIGADEFSYTGIDPKNAREGSQKLRDRMIDYHRKHQPGCDVAKLRKSNEVWL